MSKIRIVFTLAMFLVLIPFLGFTTGQLKGFSFVIGAILLGLTFSLSVQIRRSPKSDVDKSTESSRMFVDGPGSSHSDTV